jgi:magnesium-protoporphyrin IX monomethyl ester (oxidative) cyclase
MRPGQLRRIAEGGVSWIQPGIESLDDRVLKLMNKGVTGLQNIRLMRSCAEIGIRVIWSLLCGFPGETAEQYRYMAGIMKVLEHLEPPNGHSVIRLDRFSPYFERAVETGFDTVRPVAAYDVVYGLDADLLARLAYFFDGETCDLPEPGYLVPIEEAISAWRQHYFKPSGMPDLSLIEVGPLALLKDTRSCAVDELKVLGPDERRVLDAFREPARVDGVLTAITPKLNSEPHTLFDELVRRGYIVTDPKRHALTLVLYPGHAVHNADTMTDFPGGWLKKPSPDESFGERFACTPDNK